MLDASYLFPQLKSELRLLTKKHKCSPTMIMALPLVINIPLFITASLLLRTALFIPGFPMAAELIPWWSPSPELQERFEESIKVLKARGVEGEALEKLTQVQGPTLREVDKTMSAPIGLGLLTLVNVELGQWLRRGMLSERENDKKLEEQYQSQIQAQTSSKKPVYQSFVKQTNARGQQVVHEAQQLPPEIEPPKHIDLSPLRAIVLGNTLRAGAIVFVVVSSQAPTGLVIYWLSSAAYTLVQNTVFAFLDQGKRRQSSRVSHS